MNPLSGYLPELTMGLSSLLAHKLRSLLTMLGMIFGVGAVVAMLSITAGAEKQMMSFIDQLGVNNIIVEAHEAVDRNELQQIPGRFFSDEENMRSEPVCVLGESAKLNLLGYDDAIGKYVKINDVWLQVIGVLTPQSSSDSDVEGVQALNRNNLVIAPLNTVMRRFEDNNSWLKDEIDGIYIRVTSGTDSIETANVVRAILSATHKDAGDFTVVVPAGLLEERRRTQFIFKVVMICIAGISLLVGGIGILNIMLATVLERTRELGIRRAIGARQNDIVRQFMTEAVLISIMGGLLGIVFGFTLSKIIASAAGWSTVVTTSVIVIAFGVSVFIGLLFGIYPAVQAAKLDPIEAIRYE